MLRLLFLFLVLFAGATALIVFLPKPASHEASASSVAVALRDEADPRTEKPVRIVYPPSSGSTEASPPGQSAGAAVDHGAATAAASPAVANEQAQATASPPTVPNATEASQQSGSVPQADLDAVLQATAKVDLNTASVDQLDQIPGGGRIGRAIARRRPYRSVEDLLTKRVVRKSVYDRIKDEVAAQ